VWMWMYGQTARSVWMWIYGEKLKRVCGCVCIIEGIWVCEDVCVQRDGEGCVEV